MVNTQESVENIINKLQQVASPERREFAKNNTPTAMFVLGVKTPDIRRVVIEYSKKLRKAPSGDVIALVEALIESNIFECR